MKTTFTEESDKLVMSFEGRLDTAASIEVGRDMQVLNDCNGRDIILDVTNLDYISSSGLRLFLKLLKDARACNSTVSITGMSEYLRQVFDETGFTRLFNII